MYATIVITALILFSALGAMAVFSLVNHLAGYGGNWVYRRRCEECSWYNGPGGPCEKCGGRPGNFETVRWDKKSKTWVKRTIGGRS